MMVLVECPTLSDLIDVFNASLYMSDEMRYSENILMDYPTPTFNRNDDYQDKLNKYFDKQMGRYIRGELQVDQEEDRLLMDIFSEAETSIPFLKNVRCDTHNLTYLIVHVGE